VAAGELPDAVTAAAGAVTVEPPKRAEHGDYATNAALQLAKPAGQPPRQIAELLATRLRALPAIASVDIAGPGFLNVTLASGAMGELARTIAREGTGYGHGTTGAGQKVNLEFVSANPTGPVHIGGARWAAVGDARARLLAATGAEVTREYYINDAGAQIDRFAASLAARARGEDVPEDGYAGAYIDEIAKQVLDRRPGLLEESPEAQLDGFRAEGMALMLEEIKATLSGFGVQFDVWFHESWLHERGELGHAVDRLREQGHVFEDDGAVWLRTTDFGDDKDRVLTRSNGEPTYFCADVAYYLDKRERGFDRCIYMLGADHHGYIGRLVAAAACFGDDPAQTLQVDIGQLVSLVRDGEPVKMSKRAGTVITLDDLIDAVGVDAARYALARASTDQTLEIDLGLWARKTSDNPVFYVQYAHARIASLLRNAAELGFSLPGSETYDEVDVAMLADPHEVTLLRALGEFPGVVASAAELRAPHRIARYLEEQVAPAYHKFYDACRILPRAGEQDSPQAGATRQARLLLCEATRTVLANGLGLLGVTAPDRM
jgi:arginyl-tRNA synthetase